MISLSAKIRTEKGRKTRFLREQNRIPAVVYGFKKENILVDVDYQEFLKVLKKVGESTLFELRIEGEKKERLVLIHDIQRDPISDRIIHIDFFQPSLKEEVEAEVPLVFEGTAPAVKELGGTLVKNLSVVKIKALPQHLVHELKVSLGKLKTFKDHIFIKDISLPPYVKILVSPTEIVASVVPPEDVEKELGEKIEEKVEEVKRIEKEKEEGLETLSEE